MILALNQFIDMIWIVVLLEKVPAQSLGRRVLHNVQKNEVKVYNTSLTLPDTLDDILNTPQFIGKKNRISEDADLWAEALSEYENLLRKQRKSFDVNDDDNDPYNPYISKWKDPGNQQVDTIDEISESPSTMPRSGSGVLMRVVHSDKAQGGNEPSTPPAVCKPDSNEHTGQDPVGSQEEDGKLTVFDRLLENSVMTQALMYGNCGKSRPLGTVCYGIPSGCVEEGACRLIVSIGYDESNPSYISVNLAGETFHNGFVAVAFSHDRFIGRDLLVYCISGVHLSKPAVALFLAFTTDYDTIMQRSRYYHQTNFCPRFGFQQGEMLACSFDLAGNVYLDDGSHTDIKNSPLYLMLSFGHFIDSVSPKHSEYGKIKYHHLVQFSNDPVLLRTALLKPKIVQPGSRLCVLLHAICAVISFIFLIPVGIFFAKYGREAYAYNTSVYAQLQLPAWLRNHLLLCITSVPLSLMALIAILVELDFTWRSVNTMSLLHSVAGIFAYLFISTNIACAVFFRCKGIVNTPNNRSSEDAINLSDPRVKRSNAKLAFWISWIHFFTGNASYLCAVFCVFIVSSVERAQAPCFVEYFAYFHFSVYLCLHIALMLNTRFLAKKFGDESHFFQRVVFGPMIAWGTHNVKNKEDFADEDFHKLEFWKWRKVAILYFCIVSAISAFTISVLLLFPVVLCR